MFTVLSAILQLGNVTIEKVWRDVCGCVVTSRLTNSLLLFVCACVCVCVCRRRRRRLRLLTSRTWKLWRSLHHCCRECCAVHVCVYVCVCECVCVCVHIMYACIHVCVCGSSDTRTYVVSLPAPDTGQVSACAAMYVAKERY